MPYNRDMKSPNIAKLLVVLPLLVACATTQPSPYPPFDGRWLYDYAASVGDDATLPPDFGESISRLDREGRNEDHKQLEMMAMKLRPSEIIRIEYIGSSMLIRGGGGFERNYDLSGMKPTPGVEVKWDMTRLEATMTDDRIQVQESYELSLDRMRLTILIRMDSPLLDEPLEMRRVYTSSKAF